MLTCVISLEVIKKLGFEVVVKNSKLKQSELWVFITILGLGLGLRF